MWSSLSQVKQAIQMTQLYPASTNAAVMPTLLSTFNAGNEVFNWSGSYILQSAPTVTGPWTNLTALGISPYTNTLVSDPARFFRLKAN